MKQIFLYLINPVTIVAIIFLLGLISSRVKNKLKFYAFGLSIFVISSTPIFSYIFSYPLIHAVKTANEDRLRNIETVIVLSAGIKKNVIGDWVPSNDSIDRVTLGKYYSENLSVPLVISGGKTIDDTLPEAVILKNYFDLQYIVMDQNSKNTFESSKNLSQYCKKNKGPFLIITGHYHRLRSYLSFLSQKCDVYLLEYNEDFQLKFLLPSLTGIRLFQNLIYEYLGLVYYTTSNKIKLLVLLDI